MPKRIEFDQDGWQVIHRPDGTLQIRGRGPGNILHALFEIVAIEEPRTPGFATVAVNADGQRFVLVKV